MNNSVRFNEFDGLSGTDDSRIKALYTVKEPGNELNVIFLKGFSTGINYTVTVDKSDIKAEEQNDLEANTAGNVACKQHFVDLVSRGNTGQEFLIIWDGDSYDKTCYTEVIPELLKEISGKGMTYRLIAYRSANFEEFKNSWLTCPDMQSVEINIVKGPLVSGNHYEDLAIFSREKTASFLNPSDVNRIGIFLFGGGPILEAELTPRLPFEMTEIMIYNVTRVRGEKGAKYFQRNYIFKDSKYSANGEIPIAKYFRVKKDGRAICIIEDPRECLEEFIFSSKNLNIRTRKGVGSPVRKGPGRPRGSPNKSKPRKSVGSPRKSVGRPRKSVGRPRGSRNKRSR